MEAQYFGVRLINLLFIGLIFSCTSSDHTKKNDEKLDQNISFAPTVVELRRVFNKKRKLLHRIYFADEPRLSAYVTYSSVGYNKVDSVNFTYSDKKVRIDEYRFTEGSSTEKYKTFLEKSVEYNVQIYQDSILMSLKDKYNLSRFYISPLRYLKSLEELDFKTDSIKPSIFMDYGFKLDDVLFDYKYSIIDGFLEEDQYIFLDKKIDRVFIYENSLLSEVMITIKDSSGTRNITEIIKW